MKSKLTLTFILLVLALSLTPVVFAKKDWNTIQSGEIYSSTGEVLTVGFDEYGYNYQARLFNGLYGDYDRVHGGPNPGVYLMMKWNDAWLSNIDQDLDHTLDRHYGFPTYIGSGAWLTNHMWGTYTGEDGKEHHWTYFVKIVAAPADATLDGEVWYTAGGVEIGPAIWGSFTIIQQVENDPYGGLHGLQYLSPASAGFGYYKP